MKKIKTLIRLDASPYQGASFFQKEEEMAQNLGLSYHFLNSQKGGEEYLPPELKFPFAVISNTHTKPEGFSQDFLDKIALWLHPNSGYDNFDYETIRHFSFPVILGNSIRAPAVAEYIFSCLLSHFSPIPHHDSWDTSRLWDRPLISEKRITILGYGPIGKLLYSSLSPLTTVSVIDPYKKGGPLSEAKLSQLAPQTDVLILACSLNKENRGIINRELLHLLPPDFLLINAARGELIKTSDLFQVLSEKEEAFAYLDVFEIEPFNLKEWEGGRFSHLKNMKRTSHIAGVSAQLNQRIIDFEFSILSRFIENSSPQFLESFKNEKNLILQNRVLDKELI